MYGDVGWSLREEIGVIDRPGLNLGWPLFEGFDPVNQYWRTTTEAQWTSNPLAGEECPDRFLIRDLIVEDNVRGHVPSNPCAASYLKPHAWSGASPSTTWAGWTGEHYLRLDGVAGKWADFSLEVPEPGERAYGVRFANGYTNDRPMMVSVNGIDVQQLEMPPTGDWRQWRTEWIDLDLSTGSHDVRIRSLVADGPIIDRIDVPDLPHQVIADTPTFVHHRPMLDWKHNGTGARVARFSARGDGGAVMLGGDDSPVAGSPFGGNCVTGGVLIDDPRWPAAWRGYYFADYVFGWIRLLRMKIAGEPIEVVPFDNPAIKTTCIVHDPASNSMVLVRWSQNPIRVIPPAPRPCPADFDGDGEVRGPDLGFLLQHWHGTGPADLNGDGQVDQIDFGLLLQQWGPCAP